MKRGVKTMMMIYIIFYIYNYREQGEHSELYVGSSLTDHPYPRVLNNRQEEQAETACCHLQVAEVSLNPLTAKGIQHTLACRPTAGHAYNAICCPLDSRKPSLRPLVYAYLLLAVRKSEWQSLPLLHHKSTQRSEQTHR